MRSVLLQRAPQLDELESFTDSVRPTGALAETFRRVEGTFANVSVNTSQKLLVAAVTLKAGVPVTGVGFFSGTQGLSVPTNWWFAILDASRNLMRQSTDQLSAAWGASTKKTLAIDSCPITAIALVSGTTYRYTFAGTPNIANGDSLVIVNCSPVGYNGTYAISNVTGTTFDANIGSNPAAFTPGTGTFQMAAAKRLWVPTASGLYYIGIMPKASTVLSMLGIVSNATMTAEPPIVCGQTADVSLVGVCPSPAGAITAAGNIPYGFVY